MSDGKPVRLHALVQRRGGDSKRGIVLEVVRAYGLFSPGMALVWWRRHKVRTWVPIEQLGVVAYRNPSPASKRRLMAKIKKATEK